MYLNPYFSNKAQGLGLPVAIFIILIMSLLAIVLTRMTSVSVESFSRTYLSAKALYAAETGAQVNLAELLRTGGGAGNCLTALTFTVTGLTDCSAVVTCTDQSFATTNLTEVESAGQCGNGIDLARRTIRVKYIRD